MKVLYFTNSRCVDDDTIPDIIRQYGDITLTSCRPVSLEFIQTQSIDFVVSDRSESLIKQPVLDALPFRIINLHPSFLPWNRGYHPNYWACREKTPFGVTIHRIDAGIDTGAILAQTRVGFSEDDTLRTTYDRLRGQMVGLFNACWPLLRKNELPDLIQESLSGSFHLKKDFDEIIDQLKAGWNTKISDL